VIKHGDFALTKGVKINRFDRERAFVRGGHLARLRDLEVRAWAVLMAHSDFRTGRVFMSMARIAELIGTENLGRARKAVQGLEEMGIIRTVHAGGGRDEAAVREVLMPSPVPGFGNEPAPDLFSELEAVVPSAPPAAPKDDRQGLPGGPMGESNRDGSRQKQGRFATETGTVCASKQGRFAPETGTVCVPPSYISEISYPPPPTCPPREIGAAQRLRLVKEEGGGDLRGADEMGSILVSRGIYPHSAKSLSLAGMTREMADGIWKDVVNDRAVKERPKVYYRRLVNALASRIFER
jgi:hypothetical protein